MTSQELNIITRLQQVIGVLLGFLCSSDSKESGCNAEDPGLIPGSEDPMEKGMTIHFSILAWRTPWTEDLSKVYMKMLTLQF